MSRAVPVLALVVMTVCIALLPHASAQFQQGGVDYPGEWYVGEGLEQGDYFSYRLCHVEHDDCTEFEMEFWISGLHTVGSEDVWVAETVVYDGAFTIKGVMELGTVVPEPTGGTEELISHRSAFKSSLAWLSAYATAETGLGGKEPKKFSDISWGKIANIGGEQILPTAVETINVPAGTFETVLVSWKTGGAANKVWVLDDFPFPIKAKTFAHVPTGIPPVEYEFVLLDHKKGIEADPFANIKQVLPSEKAEGCTEHYELVDLARTTTGGMYIIEIKYGPEKPVVGCDIEWFINFKSKFSTTMFIDEVQFDILVVDDDLLPKRSIAEEEGRNFLFAPSGQVLRHTTVMEEPGTNHYVIWVYGTGPRHIVPMLDELDYLQIDIDVLPSDGIEVVHTPKTEIPAWVKTTTGFWAGGQITDGEFVGALEFLIRDGIVIVPPTQSGAPGGAGIPEWVKATAGYWVDGASTDDEFASAIQYLIREGVIAL